MLNNAIAWVFYGEKAIWRISVLGLCLALLILGFGLTRSHWRSYTLIKDQFDQKNALIHQYRTILKEPPPEIKKIPSISWKKLARKYQLAYRKGRGKHYFSGSTENIFHLLHEVFSQAYPIDSFELTKSEHKTLLAIEP